MELAGLHERGDRGPVLCALVVTGVRRKGVNGLSSLQLPTFWPPGLRHRFCDFLESDESVSIHFRASESLWRVRRDVEKGTPNRILNFVHQKSL